MREYERDDRIFLFGFSRGAFTARALAGMVHACGVLRPQDEHLLPYAVGLYRTSEQRIHDALRCQGLQEAPKGKDHVEWDDRIVSFKHELSRECRVHFLGLWETVKAYGWIWPQSFPALRHNPSVRMVRHAVALDERRPVFQVTGWGDRRPIAAPDGSLIDAVREVWFAGDHSDVGGGHPTGNSGLTDASLEWMLGEATHQELRLRRCDQSRQAVQAIRERALNAHTVTPHDLGRAFWPTRLLPRGRAQQLHVSTRPRPGVVLDQWPPTTCGSRRGTPDPRARHGARQRAALFTGGAAPPYAVRGSTLNQRFTTWATSRSSSSDGRAASVGSRRSRGLMTSRLVIRHSAILGAQKHVTPAAAPRSVEHAAPGAPVRRTPARPPPP